MLYTIDALYKHFLSSLGICTDSRLIEKDCLFFALKGENFDGNQYAVQAIEKGASLAVVDNPKMADNKHCFLVDDVLQSLQNLAQHHRKQLKIPVIGITGSNGKTTTKELMGRVLEKKYQTFYTQGNLNNHIGVPLSILSVNSTTEIAIIEMGANHPGEIADLCKIAMPDYGLITNIGKAHLEGFGGFQGVVKTKSELYQFLALRQGKVFVNADDPLLMDLTKKLDRFTYGATSDAEIQGGILEKNPFLKIMLQLKSGEFKIDTQLIGDYNIQNILAAASVGVYFGVDDASVSAAIGEYSPDNMRSQYIETGRNKLILDAYNANPTSMAMALKNFAELEANHKMIILGDMLELGNDSMKEHNKILEDISDTGIDQVILVGKEFKLADAEKQFLHFESSDGALTWLSKNKTRDYTILIKGSRGIQLEKLVEAF